MIALALMLLQPSVPPPTVQSTADCARPVYASDILVCSDADLTRVDADMVRLLADKAPPTGQWIEAQDSWFRRSRMCAFQTDHKACLTAAYHERIGLLRAAAGAVAPVLQCTPSGYAATMQPEGLALRDGDGRLLGLAARATAGWQPYLRLHAESGHYRIEDQSRHLLARCPHPDVG